MRAGDAQAYLRVEDLNIAGSARTKLTRSFADAAFGQLLRPVRYKAGWHGERVVAVGRFYPSSKTCGARGYVSAGLALAERVRTRAACGPPTAGTVKSPATPWPGARASSPCVKGGPQSPRGVGRYDHADNAIVAAGATAT